MSDPPEQLHSAAAVVGDAGFEAARSVASYDGSMIEHARLSLAASGHALRLDLPDGLADEEGADRLHERIAAIRPVAGFPAAVAAPRPVAIGALPFDRQSACHLTVPSHCVRRTSSGSSVLTIVGRDPERIAAQAERAAGDPAAVGEMMRAAAGGPSDAPAVTLPPDQFSLVSVRDHNDFTNLVARCVEDIRRGTLDKVVLVREVLVESNRPLQSGDLLGRLRALYPSCTAFSVEGFVGASPELLLERAGRQVASHPLAGTVGRSGDPDTDLRLEQALLDSAKERAEHRVVVDAVARVLSPFCDRLAIPDAPSIVELRNVSHLGTAITGRLAPAAPGVLGLVARLHPTPAVAGTPRDEALEWIAKHEELDRGPYAGPVGWTDGHGDGEWYVGIRAALVDGCRARLFAGVGIVAESDPAAELTETQLKLQAMLAAAVRP